MYKWIVSCLFLFLVAESNAQGYINQKKRYVKKEAKKRYKKNRVKFQTLETDSTLTFLIRDSSLQPADYIIAFDKNNRAYKETVKFYCDSCFQKHVKSIFAQKILRLTKVDENSYYTRFPFRMILNYPTPEPFTTVFHRSEIKGKLYRQTVRNALKSKAK